MSASSRGSARERWYGALREQEGWIVYRAAGSHGNADLVLLKPGPEVMLSQVKGDRDSPWTHFGPAARARLIKEARTIGAAAELAHIPSKPEMRVYTPEEWPR